MPIRPCVFSDEVHPEFEEAVRLSKEAGAEGLEIRGRMFGRAVTHITDDDVANMDRILDRYGVQVAVIGSPVGKCDMEKPEELEQHQRHFDRMLELARHYDTRVIRGFALWRPGRRDEPDHVRPNLEEFMERVVAFLTPIVRKAEAAGVVFSLETEGSTLVGTCDETRRVMEALGNSPALQACWDVNNGAYNGEEPYPTGYELIRGRVAHVHVKPNPENSLATVANTQTTYEQILTRLRDDGYQGWASIEHWGSPELMLEGLRQLTPVLQRVNGE